MKAKIPKNLMTPKHQFATPFKENMPQSVRISSGKKKTIGAKRNTLDIMAAHDLEKEMAKKPKKDKWDLPELAIYKMENILRLQKSKLWAD